MEQQYAIRLKILYQTATNQCYEMIEELREFVAKAEDALGRMEEAGVK